MKTNKNGDFLNGQGYCNTGLHSLKHSFARRRKNGRQKEEGEEFDM